jgi:hypothetical protein
VYSIHQVDFFFGGFSLTTSGPMNFSSERSNHWTRHFRYQKSQRPCERVKDSQRRSDTKPRRRRYFQFCWTLLEGRIFASWTYPHVDFWAAGKAKDNDRQSSVRLAMDASVEQPITCVAEALKPLSLSNTVIAMPQFP